MWLLSGVPDNPEDNSVMEQHGAEALHAKVKRLMHAIQSENEEAQQDAAHQTIKIGKSWTISWRSES